MSEQDQPYAYLAKPHWHRDDVEVFPDLASLVTRCDAGKTFRGPDSLTRLRGAFRASPDLPFEDQVAQYIESSPWRWKCVEELISQERKVS